jgi:small subunit ribosomal protein S20
MANIKSKQKNIKRIQKRTIRNRATKSKVRTAIKKVKKAIISKEKNISELLSLAHKEIDKAVSKGVFHKNNGSRKSSKLDNFVRKNFISKKI